MYSYIIVDDEPLIRKGLIVKISEAADGEFQCIGEASNGMEGAAKVQELAPDIIITDMQMAKMDGVGFLEYLGKNFPDKPIIVISAYKEFDYMNKAIEENVIGYVLKPCSQEELEKQLYRAVERIEQKRYVKALSSKVADYEYRMNTVRYLEMILQPWSETFREEIEQEEKLRERIFRLMVLYTDLIDAEQQLAAAFYTKLGEENVTLLLNPADRTQYILLFHLKDEEALCDFQAQMSIILSKIKHSFQKNKIHIAMTGPFREIENMNVAFRKCERMLENVFIGTSFYYQQEKGGEEIYAPQAIYDKGTIKEFERRIRYEHKNTDAILKEFFSAFNKQKYTLGEMRETCAALMDRIHYYASANQTVPPNLMQFFSKKLRFADTIDVVVPRFTEYILGILDKTQQQNGSEDAIYWKMVQYVTENYNQKLTLQLLADQFYISSASCGSMFRERMNMSFNEYLNGIRIHEAKKMLTRSEMTIEQISNEVGYSNPKYFFKIFKQMENCTPTEYKNRKGWNKDVL